MTSAVYNGFAQAATLPCSPASDLYDAQLAAQYAYSATAFQAAIHNAGVPTSETDCPVLLVCSDDPARVRAAEYLSSSMQENGFFLKVRSLGREAYVAALQAGNYDAYLGEVRLTANFDLSEFFRTGGALSYGAVADTSLAGLCTQALGNSGSYADLCARLLDTVPFCPIVFKSYEVCVSRGAIASISPGVDCVFHNAATARTLADADHSYDGAAEPSTPTNVSADPAEPTEPADAADPTQEPLYRSRRFPRRDELAQNVVLASSQTRPVSLGSRLKGAAARCSARRARPSHVCEPSGIFSDVHAAGENDCHFLCACGRKLCEAFFDS